MNSVPEGGGEEPAGVAVGSVLSLFGLHAASGAWGVAADWLDERRPEHAATAAAMRAGIYALDESGYGYGYGDGDGDG
jgi:hypothetical protein